MQSEKIASTNNNRLRVVFDEAVVSLNISSNSTFADVAFALSELPTETYGNPLSVNLIFGRPSRSRQTLDA